MQWVARCDPGTLHSHLDSVLYRRYDFYPWLGFKLQMNLAPEAGVSQGMVDFDVKVRCPACC